MKKIMVALSVVALVAFAQAGSFKWGTGMGQAVYKAGTETKLGTAYTAYLFDSSTYAQGTLLSAFLGSGIDYSKSLSNKALSSSGTIASTQIDAVSGQAYSLYAVVVDDKNVYISEYKDVTGPDGSKSTTVYFSPTTSSKAAALDSASGYVGAGWYTTAVPEPTSGLLMLLGIAGLALRRRRA